MPELRRMLPSSNALFVFDAAARNGSFTAAAAELNVTQRMNDVDIWREYQTVLKVLHQ